MALSSRTVIALLLAGSWLASNPFLASAQNPDVQKWQSIRWEQGPCKSKVGHIGEIDVPAGYKFTGLDGTRALLEITRNVPTPNDLGILCPLDYDLMGQAKPDEWFLVFEWDPVGYVKDDEKDKLNADEMLKSLKELQVQGNEQRRKMGLPTLELVGWARPPFYDPQTNLLSWGTRNRSENSPLISVNYNTRFLGREGVMSANLIISEEALERNLDKYKNVIKGYTFVPGKRYAEFRAGDKVAAYGLTALVAGGAAGLAAKAGWLSKLGKPLIAGVIFIFAGIGSIFKKIFGRKESV